MRNDKIEGRMETPWNVGIEIANRQMSLRHGTIPTEVGGILG
jgi:hypothetical protein